MTRRMWILLAMGFAAALTAPEVLTQGKGHDKKKEKDKDDQGEDHDRDHRGYYRDEDREKIRHWYGEHEREGLPPGLAKRDQLPPGLERQLVERGELPPGLRKKIHPCPPELVRVLPPPPPDCENVVIGGHFVLLNVRTNVVQAVFHLEIP